MLHARLGEWVDVNIADASEQFKKGKAENKTNSVLPKAWWSQAKSFGLDLYHGVAARGMFNPHWALIPAATENENPLEIQYSWDKAPL